MRREILLSLVAPTLLSALVALAGCVHAPGRSTPEDARTPPEDTWEYGVECRNEALPEGKRASRAPVIAHLQSEGHRADLH